MKNKILKMLLIMCTMMFITGCSNKETTSDDNNNQNHSDTFTKIEVDKNNMDESVEDYRDDIPKNTEPYDDRDTAKGLVSDLVVDDNYIASLEQQKIEENIQDNLEIDYKVTTDDVYVRTAIYELYILNGYTNHEVINEFYSDMPEIDGYEYSVSLRFNNNDVYVIYLSNGSAYSIQDTWGSYDN